MCDYVKKPCKSCPFRKDVTPFIHPQRAAEIAYSASNPYSNFPCHNTFTYDGDYDLQGRPTGDFSKTKTCAGFLTLRANEGLDLPKGFEPSYETCYLDAEEMIENHENNY